MNDDWKRRVESKREEARKLMTVSKPDPQLIAHFEAEGQPYALVEQKAARDQDHDHGLVHIIPRHMSARNWRALFWLGVKKLVVHGRTFDSLCDACSNRVICMQEGLGTSYAFECRASRATLNIDVTSRTWKEKKNGRRRSKSLA